jgi:hypothetical protein
MLPVGERSEWTIKFFPKSLCASGQDALLKIGTRKNRLDSAKKRAKQLN